MTKEFWLRKPLEGYKSKKHRPQIIQHVHLNVHYSVLLTNIIG